MTLLSEPAERPYGIEATLDLVLTRAFRELGAELVWPDVLPDNARAQRVYAAAGSGPQPRRVNVCTNSRNGRRRSVGRALLSRQGADRNDRPRARLGRPVK